MTSIYTEAFLAEIRAELEAQLARLERSMAITSEAVRPVELDQQAVGRLSRMDSMQSQSMSQSLQERERIRYAEVRGAIARVDDGTYGRCLECGTEIAAGRLMILPEVERCGSCG